MLEEIKSRYGTFGDAVVQQFNYVVTRSELKVEIIAINRVTEKWERIEILFIDIIKFQFYKGAKVITTRVFEAYLNKKDNVLIVDFFALQIGGRGLLEEDPESPFAVHCKEISYKITEILA